MTMQTSTFTTSLPASITLSDLELLAQQHASGAGEITRSVTGKTRRAVTKQARVCACCGASFDGTRRAQYCGATCRKRAQRERDRAALAVCAHCGETFKRSGHQKYCRATCRTLAARWRRKTAAAALASWSGVPVDRADDVIERQGLRYASGLLAAAGYQYDSAARCWARGA